jgi:GNAT superfamily N-acetyltransferase
VILEPRRIRTEEQVETMRQIRNAGAYGYSNDHREISVDEQREWWKRNEDLTMAWLFHASCGCIVGYGLISHRVDGHWSPSAGVKAEFAGRGCGKFIVDWLASTARNLGLTLHAQALLSNPAAVKTHTERNWEHLYDDETYAYFRSKS